MNTVKILQLLDEARALIAGDAIPPAIPVHAPRPAGAYDGARALWEAAQREGRFRIHDWIGPGIQPGAAHLGAPVGVDAAAFGDEIERLGRSDWGRAWLDRDENSAMLDPDWQRYLNGYEVRARSNNPDDGLVRVT